MAGNNLLTAVVIDDEPKARQTLKNLIARYCPDVLVRDEAGTVEKGIQVIDSVNPDLVFLDIKMADREGFEVLKAFPEPQFYVVFTTAYDQYALEALKNQAIDYLIKPIDVDELESAVAKTKTRILEGNNNVLQTILQHSLASQREKMLVPTQQGYEVVKYADIVCCIADNNYTEIILEDTANIISSKTLKHFEDNLPPEYFLRIHRSYLVNIDKVKSISKGQGGEVVMTNGTKVAIARDKKEELFSRIK